MCFSLIKKDKRLAIIILIYSPIQETGPDFLSSVSRTQISGQLGLYNQVSIRPKHSSFEILKIFHRKNTEIVCALGFMIQIFHNVCVLIQVYRAPSPEETKETYEDMQAKSPLYFAAFFNSRMVAAPCESLSASSCTSLRSLGTMHLF